MNVRACVCLLSLGHRQKKNGGFSLPPAFLSPAHASRHPAGVGKSLELPGPAVGGGQRGTDEEREFVWRRGAPGLCPWAVLSGAHPSSLQETQPAVYRNNTDVKGGCPAEIRASVKFHTALCSVHAPLPPTARMPAVSFLFGSQASEWGIFPLSNWPQCKGFHSCTWGFSMKIPTCPSCQAPSPLPACTRAHTASPRRFLSHSPTQTNRLGSPRIVEVPQKSSKKWD